jgi:hypothetical protein
MDSHKKKNIETVNHHNISRPSTNYNCICANKLNHLSKTNARFQHSKYPIPQRGNLGKYKRTSPLQPTDYSIPSNNYQIFKNKPIHKILANKNAYQSCSSAQYWLDRVDYELYFVST